MQQSWLNRRRFSSVSCRKISFLIGEREIFFSSWNFDSSLAKNFFFPRENFYREVESRVEIISIAVSHYVIRIKIYEAK